MRNIRKPFQQRALLLLLSILLIAAVAGMSIAAELLPPGFRPLPLGVHALVGGKVVIRPGEVLEGATVVIRDGLIKAVGKEVVTPPDARVWDMKGLTIYAGFIDAYLVPEATNAPVSTSDSEPVSSTAFTSRGVKFFGSPGEKSGPGPGYEIAKITPEYRAVRDYSPKEKKLAPLRELGFTAGLIAPSRGIIRGTSALVALSEEEPNQTIIKPDVFQHVAFETHQAEDRAYPGSLMGVIASVRQSFFDAQFYARDYADFEQHPADRKRPEFDPALEALGPVIGKKMRVALEPGSALMVDRAARVAHELGLEFCLVASGQEWRRPDLVKATGVTFIVPLNFPTLPKLPSPDDWEQVTLDELRTWDWAPENPAVLRQQGLEIVLTTYGLSDPKRFRENLRLALDRGLSETDALAALTVVPAKLCGVEKMMGTIEAGKLADLTIVKGDSYFSPEAKVREVWIDGRVYQVPADEPTPGESEEKESPKSTVRPEGQPAPSKEEPEKKAQPPEIAAQEQKQKQAPARTNAPGEEKPAKKDKKKEQARELQKKRVAHSPLEGRGPIAQPNAVLIQGATVWTCGPAGRLENADVLIIGGKIKTIGSKLPDHLDATEQPLLINGQGLHVTPGLIDCHSHTAILGAGNESTLPSTAMVRIHDVVNSETDNLYKQLAGGVTTVNLLHGSANPIGGQNCVVKLRDGASPEDLVFAPAPPGIKFALGENVKQSNWGEKFSTRFPQTRMGVRTFIANRFTAAKEYLEQQDANRKGEASARVAPRRNLELEALGEILQGQRWIHCHAYRQDEMLMLMRLMESFGVRIATFQHVLEGYKIAEEIAKHGAGGSTFSDWWAYKFEVYDAIPYNGSLMRDREVVVSFNSDSSELARRLYLEAAKAVKYGGSPETEALKFVTLNPARQLRIDKYVGSLEPGKDADVAIWSKSPLDSATVCLQTWIEGKKYFDRALNEERVTKRDQERKDLLAKAKQVAKVSSGDDSGGGKDGEGFFRVSLEHEYDGRERGCMDGGNVEMIMTLSRKETRLRKARQRFGPRRFRGAFLALRLDKSAGAVFQILSLAILSLLLTSLRCLAAPAETFILAGATVHTVSGRTLSPGQVLVRDGKIVEVGENVSARGATRIDLSGQHLYPGLISLDTVLGLTEIEAVRATADLTEVGDYRPDVESWIAVNPDSELIPVARANGIAYFEPVPEGGIVSGQSGLLGVDGWTSEQMTIQKPIGLHLFWPSLELDTTPKERAPNKAKFKSLDEQAKERRAKLQATMDFFEEAKAYVKAKDAAAKGIAAAPERVPAWEAMIPYVRGELPIVIHADEVRQIRSAITWAGTNHYKTILAGGRDAAMLVDLLAAWKIPVIYEHTFTLPDRDVESYDVHFTAPEALHKAGVLVVFSIGPRAFDAPMVRNLPYSAAQAVAFGMPEDEALKGLTLYPAQLAGVGDRLGSIETGKEATLFASDGNILDLRANVKRMWVAGREISLESRHTRLYEKYKNRPRTP